MTFTATASQVFIQDGPYTPRPIDQDTCDRLLGIFQNTECHFHFNQLHECMKAAGYILWGNIKAAA